MTKKGETNSSCPRAMIKKKAKTLHREGERKTAVIPL